ncbi:MAG: ATPase, T2SS/T4P/T4SS family [Myxococcota bacterium]
MFVLPGLELITPLLADTSITEIMINGPHNVWVEREGVMSPVESPFQRAEQLHAMIDAMLRGTGRTVTTSQPFVDFRLQDGSRVNVVVDPIALEGPVVTIRKFTKTIKSMADLIASDTLTLPMAEFLKSAIHRRLNIVFSGGAGTGKTTLLGMCSRFISERERIVVIEDTAELELQQKHTVRLECRPPNMQGAGRVDQGQLLRNSLRMRPSRIIVGEVRGDEAIEMLQAMTSGHDGCLAVLHASSPAHAISRLEMMVLSRGLSLPLWGIQRQIVSALNLIVQMAMHEDGKRRVTHISEVVDVHEGQVRLRDLFLYQRGYDDQGEAVGEFRDTDAAIAR